MGRHRSSVGLSGFAAASSFGAVSRSGRTKGCGALGCGKVWGPPVSSFLVIGWTALGAARGYLGTTRMKRSGATGQVGHLTYRAGLSTKTPNTSRGLNRARRVRRSVEMQSMSSITREFQSNCPSGFIISGCELIESAAQNVMAVARFFVG